MKVLSLQRPDWPDAVAALSLGGLLATEAVAYARLAQLPAQAGVVALFAGLIAYGLLGSSRFAVVSATSSSAAVLLATSASLAGPDPRLYQAIGSAVVLLAGAFFLLASIARLGAASGIIARPVLRGLAAGIALTIVVRQLPTVFGLSMTAGHAGVGDIGVVLLELARRWHEWNWASAALAAAALVALAWLRRWPMLPGALLVMLAGIALDDAGLSERFGIARVGPLGLHWAWPVPPDLAIEQWLRAAEFAIAVALIVLAESYGSIQAFAMRHGDRVSPNRDLAALGVANVLAGIWGGLPVGAGYSATSANEAAGARSRWAGLVAAACLAVAIPLLQSWFARIPQPLLAAVVVHAVGHTVRPEAVAPYFRWRRDRLLAVAAIAAVLVFGILDGLIASIALSLLLLLHKVARSRVSWLGQLGDSHDYVDVARHPEARVPAGIVIARPDVPVFFANAEALFNTLRQCLQQQSGLRAVILSLEESPDLDGTALEVLGEFATWACERDLVLLLARAKDNVRDLLDRAQLPALPPAHYRAWSVDDAVRQALPAMRPLFRA